VEYGRLAKRMPDSARSLARGRIECLSLAPLLLHARMTGKKFVAINYAAFVGIDAAALRDARNAISQNYDP